MRLKLLTSTLVLFTCLFAVTSEDLSASMAGLSVTSALQVSYGALKGLEKETSGQEQRARKRSR